MKSDARTERLVILVTPQFKAHIALESERSGISVAEFVRSRFEQEPSSDEAELGALVRELQASVVQARQSLSEGLAEAESMLLHLRAGRRTREAQPSAQNHEATL